MYAQLIVALLPAIAMADIACWQNLGADAPSKSPYQLSGATACITSTYKWTGAKKYLAVIKCEDWKVPDGVYVDTVCCYTDYCNDPSGQPSAPASTTQAVSTTTSETATANTTAAVSTPTPANSAPNTRADNGTSGSSATPVSNTDDSSTPTPAQMQSNSPVSSSPISAVANAPVSATLGPKNGTATNNTKNSTDTNKAKASDASMAAVNVWCVAIVSAMVALF